MPKLWNETIDAHRRSVREAILDSAWTLATEHGVLSVTMTQVAERAGIGRATLYKYFPDVEAILAAQHQRHVDSHLARLIEIRDQHTKADQRLRSAVEHYANICHHRAQHGTEELAALLHRGHQVDHAQQHLATLFEELIADAAAAGHLRNDVAPAELTTYCLHALGAAGNLRAQAAVKRLVAVTLDGLGFSPSSAH
ncbi:TetR/AcrR family transcriptional regulator [Kribbella sancticallisti]|uniref:TetR/AcrR family transcriptional regulator n=1 Tax=Kribbella sancticallisti TaxID=460087 RepID=UPI0031DB61E0